MACRKRGKGVQKPVTGKKDTPKHFQNSEILPVGCQFSNTVKLYYREKTMKPIDELLKPTKEQ